MNGNDISDLFNEKIKDSLISASQYSGIDRVKDTRTIHCSDHISECEAKRDRTHLIDREPIDHILLIIPIITD
jgi:hypothetical protein